MFSNWETSENDRYIEDTITMILESSSEKPSTSVQKRPNCVDLFNETHQGEYEARGQQSKNFIQRVQQHNAAYPKMYDELEKRRSIMQIAAIKASKQRNFQCECNACAKLTTLRNLKSQHAKSRYKGRKRYQSRCRTGTSMVKRCEKNKARPYRRHRSRSRGRRSYQRSRHQSRRPCSLVDRGCQCISYIYVTNKQNSTLEDFTPEIDPDRHENASKPKRKLSGTFYSDLGLDSEPMVKKMKICKSMS